MATDITGKSPEEIEAEKEEIKRQIEKEILRREIEAENKARDKKEPPINTTLSIGLDKARLEELAATTQKGYEALIDHGVDVEVIDAFRAIERGLNESVRGNLKEIEERDKKIDYLEAEFAKQQRVNHGLFMKLQDADKPVDAVSERKPKLSFQEIAAKLKT